MTRALIVRVGADSGNAYILSPVFPKQNNEYVFLPLGDEGQGIKIDSKTKVYKKEIIKFLGEEYLGKWLHVDPYFDEKEKVYTYGDRTHSHKFNLIPQKQKLLGLKEDCYLVFCSTMVEMSIQDYKISKRSEIRKRQKSKQKHLYIFGYFKIKQIDTITSRTSLKEKEKIANLYIHNAHIIRKDHFDDDYLPKEHPEKKLILILGDSVGSQLLEKAIKLTSCRDRKHYIEQKWIPFFGREDFGTSRGLCQWIDNPSEFIEEIKKGIPNRKNAKKKKIYRI